MPFARIDLIKGKSADYRAKLAEVGNTKELKFAFYRQIADELTNKLGVRPDDIMINMVFVNKEDWSFGKGQPW